MDYDLTEAMRNAAIRGVKVKIITPGIADKKLVKLMTKSSYSYLVSKGVEIYEYTKGFIHEKTVVSDDKYLTVGTINLDYRSFAHHYENGVWIYSSKTVFEAKEKIESVFKECKEITEKDARLGLMERIVRNLLRLFAPIM
jgi:cardiolipin synthase